MLRDEGRANCYKISWMDLRGLRLGRTRPGRPFVDGHRVELLVDGGPYFERLLEDIARAQRYIYIEAYILSADDTGWRVANALVKRAQAGVEVAICYDGYGSDALTEKFLGVLDSAGIKYLAFRPLSPFKGSWPWSRRNHRKMALFDGQVAIVGGLNISNDYAAPEDGGSGWRDTAVRIEGPAVIQLHVLFRRLWKAEKGSKLVTALPERPAPVLSGLAVRFIANFVRGERAIIRRSYEGAIQSAQDSVQIMSAYFFPHRKLRRSLEDAARRGVRVQLILGSNTDVGPAKYAARSLYARLLKAGVEIYEWHERVLHAKTAVVDAEWTTVGSSNLDPFSFFVNLELNAGIFSQRFGAQMVTQFEEDRSHCVRVDPETWARRPWREKLLEFAFRWVSEHY